MKIIDYNNSGSAYTYIGFTNSSLTVDEDYETVVKKLEQARDVSQIGMLFIELHSGGEPVLIAVDKIEVIGEMEGEEW